MRIANVAAAGTFEPPQVPPHLISPDVTVETVLVDYFLYPGDPVSLMLDGLAYLEASIRAEAAGFDVVYLNSTADYGIELARSALRIPVVGAGQSSMLMATSLGRRFSVVTIWPQSLNFTFRQLLRDYDLVDRCASIRHVSSDAELARIADEDSFYNGMRAGREDMLSRISNEIRLAVELDGADVIMLGCTCMSPVADELGRRAPVPVIDAEAAGYLAAEAAGRIGLVHSPTTYQRPADNRPAMLRNVTTTIAGTLESEPDVVLACEVCEIIN